MADHANNYSGGAPQSDVPGHNGRRITPHPLFPPREGQPEDGDIRFVTFRRRRSDGRIDHCPYDIPAEEIQSWADVVEPWGGGEYQAIGKNEFRKEVAWNPVRDDEWILFDLESRPFTPRNGVRHGVPAQPITPTPAPAIHAPAPFTAPGAPNAHGMHGPPPHAPPYGHGAPATGYAPGGPAAVPGYGPPMPEQQPPYANGMAASGYAPGMPAPAHMVQETPTTLLKEVLQELRARQANPPPAPTPSVSIEAVLIAALNAQGEMTRAALTAALTQRPAEGSATAVELLRVMREWAPQAQAPGSMSERLGEFKQLRELTTPAPVAPPPSELGEIKDIFMSVLQADAMSKTTAREAPPPSPPPVERRPPPRRPLCYVPGIGMVDEEDVHAIMSDPAARARVRNALGVGAVAPTALAEPPAMVAPVAPAPAAPPPPPIATTPAPVPIATTPAPVPIATTPAPVPIAPMPAPPAAPPMPSAPAPTVEVARPEPPPAAPAHDVNIDALLADPVQRERLLKALAAAEREALHVAEPAPGAPSAARPQPTASAVSPPTAAPTRAPAPTVTNVPAPSGAATEPSATAASGDRRAPIEPMQTAERRTRVITEDDRMRAIPALRTIAQLPLDQRRTVLDNLPGVDGAVDGLVQALDCMSGDEVPTDVWRRFVGGLSEEAVRALVDGPGG